MELEVHKKWFDNFVSQKICQARDNFGPLELKREHTYSVLANTASILEGCQDLPADAIKLAALYHDIARFDQFLRFGTFKDAQSLNHGQAGVRILKREKRLDHIEKKMQKLILIAVGLHNRAVLPASLSFELRTACNIVRDADKLDILRIMAGHLDSPNAYTPTVVLGLPHTSEAGSKALAEKIMNGKPAYYSDLINVNDYRLLLGSWFNHLDSDNARRIFISHGYGKHLIENLPEDGHYGKPRQKLLEIFDDYEKCL